jgi:Cu2+-exporting ATPase
MHLEEITEDLAKMPNPTPIPTTTVTAIPHHHHEAPKVTDEMAGRYYCPMYCEGDKTYDSNVGCPVCGMDLVKYPEKKTAKYTCPMHPEIIRDEPGDCPICGMDLVRMPDSGEDEEDETYNILKRKFIISLALPFLFLFFRWAECLLIFLFPIRFRDLLSLH